MVEICFFVFPAILALVGEMLICMRSRLTRVRLIPVYVALTLLLLVGLTRTTDLLAPLIGGFVALLLIGSAFFILAGSAVGWFSVWLIKRTAGM